jgi:hypothetical protein
VLKMQEQGLAGTGAERFLKSCCWYRAKMLTQPIWKGQSSTVAEERDAKRVGIVLLWA